MKILPLLGLLLTTSASATEATDNNARAWSEVFSKMVHERKWEQARAIAPIGERNFRTTQIWNDPQFQKTWNLWQQGNAYSLWTAGKDQRSMWRLAEGKNENRATLGVRKEADGSLWLLFARPATAPVWNCKFCAVTITINGHAQRWNVRAPNNQAATSVLGMSLPPSLFVNAPRTWDVEFPDGSKETFDVSFTPLVCRYKVAECAMLWNPL